jgi:hypothetical protein
MLSASAPKVETGSGLDLDDFTTVVMATSAAQIVWQLQFTAIRAFLKGNRRKRVVAATHVAT